MCVFVFNDIPIEETDSYKYLGTIFCTQNKTFQLNFKNTRSNAMKAIGSLRQKLRTNIRAPVSFKMILKLFDSYVMPILDYGAEVWFQGSQIHDIEYVQLWFLKTSLAIKHQTSTHIAYGETDRYPLVPRQEDIASSFFAIQIYKLFCLSTNHLQIEK